MFLVTPGKSDLGLEDISGLLCPALTSQQLYRLCTTFWDDAPAAPPPPTAAHRSSHGSSSLASLAASSPSPAPPAGNDTSGSPPRDNVAAGSGGGGGAAAADVACCPDFISGEVLEALKGSGAEGLTGNGGMVVTFLLDDEHTPLIAPEVRSRQQYVRLQRAARGL